MYSVFVVEDEIVTREGIRNSIPWDNTRFSLVGEAPDGEMALHAIREMKPDILITDIRMPFMDGLTLARIVKEDMPWVKIIILSGHDEFQYARQAITIGVEEYLLKPISSGDMLSTLERIGARLDEEKKRLFDLETLRRKVRSSDQILREKWGADLMAGRLDSRSALERADALDIDVSAGAYGVMVIRSGQNGEGESSRFEGIVESLVQGRRDVLLSLPLMGDRILLMRFNNPEEAEDRLYSLAQAVKFEGERKAGVPLSIGIGPAVTHLEEIGRSYGEAEQVLGFMSSSRLHNIMGSGEKKHGDQIHQAKGYIDRNYMSPDISLNAVATHVNISPNHFSTLFSQEEGLTFIEYLTRVRLDQAKRLLKMSSLKCSDIAYEVGYGDPHYFSFIFKKNTGISPSEYRRSEKN